MPSWHAEINKQNDLRIVIRVKCRERKPSYVSHRAFAVNYIMPLSAAKIKAIVIILNRIRRETRIRIMRHNGLLRKWRQQRSTQNHGMQAANILHRAADRRWYRLKKVFMHPHMYPIEALEGKRRFIEIVAAPESVKRTQSVGKWWGSAGSEMPASLNCI